MNKQEFFQTKIEPPEADVFLQAKRRWDSLTKPLDGFGDFETLVCKIAAISGNLLPKVSRRAAVIMCADNGIVEEGVSQSGQEITKLVAKKLGCGSSSVCVLAQGMHVDILPVDMGISCEESLPGVLNGKVCKGTRNFLKEPAMTEEEMLTALENGMQIAKMLREREYGLCASGEMGIGNTTTSAAVLSVLMGTGDAAFAGRGAGLDDQRLERKKQVIREGLEKYSFSETDPRERAFEAVRCLGGADIAGLTGLYIGCAKYHIPVVLDGLISSCAALAAERMVPGVKNFLIASHKGREAGILPALRELGLKPYLNGDMALGEGTGAILMIPLIDAIVHYYTSSGSFEQDGMDAYTRFMP